MHYTLVEAIERVGPEWLALIPKAARELEYEDERAAGEGMNKPECPATPTHT
jgi:hypothetical protein